MTLLLSILFTLALGGWYYRWQQQGTRIGGAISKPKAVWLFFALYHYFFLPGWFLVALEAPGPLRTALWVFVGLMGTRLLAQSLLMYVFKRWTPPLGIASNLTVLACLLGCLFWAFTHASWPGTDSDQGLMLALVVLLCLMLLADSYYAHAFYQLVGQQTKGKEAIWYASEQDPKFLRINQITHMANIFFLLYSGILLASCMIRH